VNLGDQRTGGVDNPQLPQFAFLPNFRRNPMGAVNHALTLGNLADAVDENSAFLLEFLDHKTIVDNLFADVNGGAEGLQRNPDDVDCSHHSGAESTRFQKQ
jgi:hypothetical protein